MLIRHTSRLMSTSSRPAAMRARFMPAAPKDAADSYPLGFVAGSAATGVKKAKGALDLVLVASPAHPCAAAAVFTTNRFCAAPVTVSRSILSARSGAGISALVVNSGCANACTGDQGLADARDMAMVTDIALATAYKTKASQDLGPSSIVMSTGVIGQHLQMDKIRSGIDAVAHRLSDSHEAWTAAAEGVMTTDTFPKLIRRSFAMPSAASSKDAQNTIRIAGWSKGAGMIHPNMATMLSAIFTDASISPSALAEAVRYATDKSFNAISVDGDTSTNDTFAVFANGASGSPTITDTSSDAFKAFRSALTDCATDLAKLIVRDGEGATKFIEIHIKGAKTASDAKTVAESIARSPLVKTAIYGCDANWGRIVCAIGYSGAESIDPSRVNLHLSAIPTTSSPAPSLHLFKDGAPFNTDESVASSILDHEDICITVDLGLGSSEARMYTCDFSHEYVSINADYRS